LRNFEKDLKKKISIIIPNYNHKPYLQQRLDTVFNQTYQNFEVILLDDASTDGSQTILKQYQNHPKVSHLLINSQNSGSPFKQWQKGINVAKGDWIWIAESDDYCKLNFLEQLLKVSYSNTVLAYCASIIIDNNGKEKGRHNWADTLDKNRWKNNFCNQGEAEIRNYLRYRNCITNASAVLFKKSAISGVSMPISMKFCGDWYIWIEILKQGHVSYTFEHLNYFRRHKTSTRALQSFQREKMRFNEYFSIILATSSFLNRIKKIKKYDWILVEWFSKKNTLGKYKILNLKMPIELFVRYLVKYKRI
jgi:glycosyltransferase involved in cell wall biosynthesis